jgi:hypothetical protein
MGYSTKPRVIEHEQSFVTSPSIPPEQADKKVVATASREAAAREAAELYALSGMPTTPQRAPAELRQPTLPARFADAVDSFDAEIFARGIAVSREKILALGRKRFDELLALERAAREEQRVISITADLTSWPSVHQSFANSNALGADIAKRKTAAVHAGLGEDSERAAQVCGFNDLWKTVAEPRAVRSIYKFRDAFESLLFGLSMLDCIHDDGKLRSKFFSSGKPAARFSDWLSVVEQEPRVTVTLLEPIGDLVCWLAHERTPAPRPLEYAKQLFGLRAPSVDQIKVARALWRAFCLGYASTWDIWDFIGRETRVRTEPHAIEIWRDNLKQQYPAIEQFHGELRNSFYRAIGGNQFLLDQQAHRLFVDESIQKLCNRLSAVIAMAVEDALPQSVFARFSNSILAVASDRHTTKIESDIDSRLEAAFPNSSFQLRMTA